MADTDKDGDDMGSVELVQAAGSVVLEPGERTLEDLARQANREHDLALNAAESAIAHAIRAGEVLLAARELVQDGWLEWLAENFEASQSTASDYMRIAHYRAHLKGPMPIKTATAVLRGMPPIPTYSRGNGLRAVEELREEAERLNREGLTHTAIAEIYGVSVSTVGRWLDPVKRERVNRVKARRKAREQAARRALREQERQRAIRRAVKKAGAATQEAWAMAERMQDVLAQAQRETEDRDARRALSEAGVHYRKMRDEIVRALGIS